tara:strand:+ start:1454 stop:1663 length:210 start_codon:yes stop_codon:yes gene_type:complete
MNCFDCGNEIPEARLDAVPDTDYCVNCADRHAPPMVARMVYNHKTAGEVFIAKGKENVRRLNREYERAR